MVGNGDGGEENKLSTDLNKIPLELVNVSGVYILYHKDQKNFYIGSASSLRARFKQHILNSTRTYRVGYNKLYYYSLTKRENGLHLFIATLIIFSSLP